MQEKILVLFAMTLLVGVSVNYAYSQEVGLATFQEIAQIIIDKRISQNVTASITLQSTSIQEIKIPRDLEQKIRDEKNISAIVITNEDECVLGVNNESCVIIKVKRNPADSNFVKIQNSTLKISDQFIGQINEIFDTDAEFHSTFIHPSDDVNSALQTSGVISGKGTISAVYTMPMEDTSSMYEKLSSILIPKSIRDSGGFYSVAKNLSTHNNAKITFSIIPTENKSLLQLRLSTIYTGMASEIDQIKPLEFLKTDKLKRSEYFSTGFYPLNSIIQVVVLDVADTAVSKIHGNVVPVQVIDDEKIPTDVTKHGWIFDPQQGQTIQGKYLFGERMSVEGKELEFSLGEKIDSQTAPMTGLELDDESPLIIIIITLVAVAAALFYLKGYKK